ncbi:phage tail length tape measure family protein [Escherichia coli]
MDQIADLVIDLSIDTADFKEQLPRVKNLLNGTAREAERAEARMKRFEESQKQAASATVIQTQAVVKHAQGHVSLAEDVERARLRMEALSRQMREEQVQAAALAAAQDKMAAAFYRQIDSVKQASAGLQELQRIQQQIRQARNSGGIAQQDYLALISEVTAKTRVLTQAEETATRQKTAFIRQLKEQTSRQKMTTTELLRAKAAQLGCSSAAEVYIRKMEKAGNTTHSLGLKSAAARRELGVMIGELARGNFGALRGSGITLANRAGWIDKLMTPKGLAVGGVIGGITAAVIGLGKAWMEGQEEGEAFNRQLELTGHYAGVTAGQLWALSKNLSGNGITQHAMAGSLAQVVGSGAFHGNDIGMVAKAAAQMERSVGQSVSDTISQFKRLKDDPVSAAKALDDELHFLTATQLEQIRVLGEQGRTSDAARIAMSALAEETGKRTSDIDNNLNALGSTLQTLSDWWKQFWDAAMNIGREDSLDAQIASLQEKIQRAKKFPWTKASTTGEYDQQQLDALQERKRQQDLQDAKEQAERNYQEQQKRRNAENAALNRMNETEAARHQREIARINAMQYADQAVRDAAIQRENERYEKAIKKKTPATRNDEATRLLLQYSQQQAQVEGQITAARQSAGMATERMTEAHKQLLALQQRISDLAGKKLTADEKSVLAHKDELIQALTLLDAKQQELQKQTALNDLKKKTIQLTSQLAEEERAHPRYGMGKRLGAADVDKWALYVIGQYCDQSVPDGFGGTEPRITCNAYLTTQRKAWDVLSDFCSAMRCMPVWNGQTLTFVQDRPSDKAWTYNRSNVVMPDDGAPFRYSFSALKDRHNAVEVNWIDPNNGWETATELVEDTQAIARYGRNVTKMDAFGCTSRGQAHRAGLWLIKTELLETQTVDFSVGAEGLRHVPGDVIEICDDDYAGISIGGRVLAVNSQTRTLTLDREITLPSSGTTLISLVDGSGNPVSVEVQSVTDGVKVKVSRVPDGVAEYSVWGLKLPTLRQRLFRCVSIRENDDGTYAITAVQHVPEKEAIVDNGAHFDGEQSGTVNGVTPPAVQHLTAEVTADSGEYQVLARWDTPKVVKGVSFLLRLTVTADDGSERLVSTARTTETTYRFTQLALGNYRLTVRAVNAWGQQGDPASVSFRIAAPAAPSRIELTPGYFQITATPHLAVYDPTVQFEFWFSEKRITDIRQVETTARYLGTALYWIAASINIKPGHDYYFYIRSVNTVGKSAFVEAVGRASDDAEGYLDFFKGKITESHLGKELLEKVDLTEDNASRLDEFSKEWKDANDKWNAMWGVKIEQTKDGKHYVAGIGLSMEDTEEGKLSQFLVAANRIAFIDPANGNETPMFVAQGNQIFMNDVFLKRLTAPTITSGGNPPAFSLTPDGKLTAKNADISGSVNANSGTLSNVTIAENCTINGTLRAEKIVGDIVKAASAAFPRQRESSVDWPSGTRTVTVTDDHPFDRQIVVLPLTFRGSKRTVSGRTTYSMCYLKVLMNGAVIYDGAANEAVQVFSRIVDMPAGRGNVILTFTLTSTRHSADIPPDTFASDVQVMVIKKQALGISVV